MASGPPRIAVPMWMVVDLPFTSSARVANPYQYLRMKATFQGPDGRQRTVDGGDERAFDLPPGDDWVLSLVRTDPDGAGR